MSNLKATRFVLVAILVLSCVFMNIMKVEARKELGYGAMRHDVASGCNRKYPSTCRPKRPVNSYRRGCEKSTRCDRVGDDKDQGVLSNNL
ncbi:protein RALF-like 3 [Capsella rubella]|uniref:protein RALF-like 3 n=1 Tax=Capsella rubella TaxID=81985 RepID=UPI000CD55179|nr:protein RALF-like 3 [Capsella rubella]